jgi:hypothetical protein
MSRILHSAVGAVTRDQDQNSSRHRECVTRDRRIERNYTVNFEFMHGTTYPNIGNIDHFPIADAGGLIFAPALSHQWLLVTRPSLGITRLLTFFLTSRSALCRYGNPAHRCAPAVVLANLPLRLLRPPCPSRTLSMTTSPPPLSSGLRVRVSLFRTPPCARPCTSSARRNTCVRSVHVSPVPAPLPALHAGVDDSVHASTT